MNDSMLLFAMALGNALLTAVWQGALLVTVVAFVLRAVPAITPAIRSLVWAATFALLVGMHFVPGHAAAGTGVSGGVRIAPIWSLGMLAIWGGLSLLRGVQFLAGVAYLVRIARRAKPLEYAFEYEKRSTLCTSADIDRPSVIGFFRPRILLPEALVASLTPAEIDQIVLHETEHLRRSDDWTNLLQKLALVVFPLNPVLYWVERRLCLERELAVDDRVLRTTGARKAYATCLTHIAEQTMVHRGMQLALGLFGVRRSELSRRIEHILRGSASSLSPNVARLATASLLVGLVAATAALIRVPHLIGFAPASHVVSNEIASAYRPAMQAPSSVPVKMTLAAPAKAVLASAKVTRKRAIPRTTLAYADAPAPGLQPRMTLILASAPVQNRFETRTPEDGQVQHYVVPAVAYVPAYAAVRVPNGWIIFQL
jgi:hypothetical protein